jgi:hydrogenase maturation protease
MNEGRILVAGIGNIFFGDDAFGVEVARQLTKHDLPDGAHVADFGIRSYDLAYAILDDYAAIIMVDAIQRGSEPGTLYLIEPNLGDVGQANDEIVNAHSLNPLRVLHMVMCVGGHIRSLYLVGCEPAILETHNGEMGLSQPVAAAVPEAIQMIKSLITRILDEKAAHHA